MTSLASSSRTSSQNLDKELSIQTSYNISPTSVHRSQASKDIEIDMRPQSPQTSVARLGKRKRDMCVLIPSPKVSSQENPVSNRSRNGSTTPHHQVFVEVPSPTSKRQLLKRSSGKGHGSPLSSKAWNANSTREAPNKKRRLDANSSASGSNAETSERDTFPCHQCSRRFAHSDGLDCSAQTHARRKAKYCKRCLKNRYGMNESILKKCNTSHPIYEWTCPKCMKICICSKCRKLKEQVTPKLATQSFKKLRLVKFMDCKPETTVSNPPKKLQKDSRPRQPKKAISGPKWTAVPTALDFTEIEDRLYLREFILRFSPIMKISDARLEELDEFSGLSRICCKALIQNLLELIAADADQEHKRTIRDSIRSMTGSRVHPSVVWDSLSTLREQLPVDFFTVPLPDPAQAPSDTEESDDESEGSEMQPQQQATRTSSRLSAHKPALPTEEKAGESARRIDNGVTHAIQFLPILLALCENALQGPSVHRELSDGISDGQEANRTYYAEVRKENSLWAEKRSALGWRENDEGEEEVGKKDNYKGKGTEKENEGPKQGKGKAKTKNPEKEKAYREAYAIHKSVLADLDHSRELGLQSGAPRFKPLGRDSQGRIYYASSARRSADRRHKVKAPNEEERSRLRKWGWFLAVWGVDGDALDETRKGSSKSSSKKQQAHKQQWWGFFEPTEIRQLAKWLTSIEDLDSKDTKAKRVKDDGGQAPPTRAELKTLVKEIENYADLLEWRISDRGT